MQWRKLANTFDYRTPPGEHLEFTRHFQTDNLSMVGAGEFVHRVEGMFFPRGAPRQASSKSLLRFSRYHAIGGNSGTALDFLNSAASARHRCKVEGSVDCPDAWTIAIGVDSLTLMLHTPAHCAVGNRFPAFSNSFNLADLWLSFVISVVRREGYRQVDNQTRKIAASLDSLSSAEIQSKVTEICSNFEAVTLRHSRLRLQANIGEIHSDPRRSSIYFALRQTWTDAHTDKMLDDLLSELQHRIIELRPRKSSRKTKSSVKSVRDSTVFISYRRSDSQDVVGRMYDRLARKFGRMRVVRDLDHLEPGKPFDIALDAAIASSSMALIIIGPTWLTTEEVSGKRRLDNPTDFVRREVECALGRDIPVVPVLVTHATMPMSADLPESIRDLVSRHGLKVRPDPDFRTDMNQLIKVVGNVLNG
jgi:hypothetical protein